MAVGAGCAAVCVNPCWVPLTTEALAGSSVAVCAVVGFPLGASTTTIKCREAEEAAASGAGEIDMVMNLGWFLAGTPWRLAEEVAAVRSAIGGAITLKVIVETAALPADRVGAAAACVASAGADFVKTSTGFHPAGGATPAAVAAIAAAVGEGVGIKAAGGIRELATARRLLDAGATRLGMSATAAVLDEAGRQ